MQLDGKTEYDEQPRGSEVEHADLEPLRKHGSDQERSCGAEAAGAADREQTAGDLQAKEQIAGELQTQPAGPILRMGCAESIELLTKEQIDGKAEYDEQHRGSEAERTDLEPLRQHGGDQGRSCDTEEPGLRQHA